MKILVCPHDLGIGGSQINAIDLAAGAAAAGHEVIVYGIAGPLVKYIRQRGLRYIEARRLRYRPAPSRIVQLAAIARRERIDLIHAYEWPPCLDAYFGAGLVGGVPILCTVLSMSVSPLVPSSVPLVMGTAALGEAACRTHRSDVWVLEPPIDCVNDHPDIDGSAFRRRHGVADDERLIVTVSRLALDLKIDALVRAVDAADRLAARHRVRLLIVGGGPAYDALSERAGAVNRRHERPVITLTGPDLDPREAYAAADVVVGMGSSALRALAIGRPLVVQGEHGFSEVFEPATVQTFLHQGFYGIGDSAAGVDRLCMQLDGLLSDASRAHALGRYGRDIVNERFSLQRAIPLQLEIYRKLIESRVRHPLGDAVSSFGRALMVEVRNHDPRDKRRQQRRSTDLIEAARSQAWPPIALSQETA